MSKMDLGAIVAKNDEIIAVLDDMERATANLEMKAKGHATMLQDAITKQIIDLLAEINKEIQDTKKKTKVFSEAKKVGAQMINITENKISSAIKKI